MRGKPIDPQFLRDGITDEEFGIDRGTIGWNEPTNPVAALAPERFGWSRATVVVLSLVAAADGYRTAPEGQNR